MKYEMLSAKTDWNGDYIMKLLHICLETHFKTIDCRIYTKVDGTPFRKSISGPLADIFLSGLGTICPL